MAVLTLISITCNQINTLLVEEAPLVLGGPVELRAPIIEGPTTRVWGPRQMQVGEKIIFANLPMDQQPNPNPISFINPTWVELWDDGAVSQAQNVEAKTGDIKPWSSDASVILSYLGGEYVLEYKIAETPVNPVFLSGVNDIFDTFKSRLKRVFARRKAA